MSDLNYDIVIGQGMKEEIRDFLSYDRKCVVITDKNVNTLYGDFFDFLNPCVKYEIDAGEKSKDLMTYSKVIDFLSENNIDRNDLLIAFGGGVVGDLTGFVASTYLRGIDFVQVPTTLLSMIDSSIGGKTGINTSYGKNLIGSFYEPKKVYIDIDFIKTLPERELKNGIAEIIKTAVIRDAELFEILAENEFDGNVLQVIKRCIDIKSEIVKNDFRESGERKLLNFGHTIGHAIEKLSGYDIPHGYTVSIGMAKITKMFTDIGSVSKPVYNVLINTLKNYSLPVETEFDVDGIYNAMLSDKKRTGNNTALIYPKEIGEAVIEIVKNDKVYEMMKRSF